MAKLVNNTCKSFIKLTPGNNHFSCARVKIMVVWTKEKYPSWLFKDKIALFLSKTEWKKYDDMGKNKLLDWCYQSTFWGVSLCIIQCACFSTSVILQIILSLNGGKFSFCSFLFMKICSHCLILKGKLFFEFCEYNCSKEGWFLYNIEEKSYCHHFGIYRQTKDIPLISSLPHPCL